MASRFKPAPDWVVEMVEEERRQHFDLELKGAEMLVVFDTKKRVKQRRYVLGQMKRAKDLERLLSESSARPEGYDYVMVLDREVFMRISDTDRRRLIRHELRHCEHDIENVDNPWKLRPHDIEDFKAEVRLNQGDPHWAERLAEVAAAIYEYDEPPPVQDPNQPNLEFEDQPPGQHLADLVKSGDSVSITDSDGTGVKITGTEDGPVMEPLQ